MADPKEKITVSKYFDGEGTDGDIENLIRNALVTL